MKSNIAIFVLAIIVGLTGCARHEQSLTGGITIAVPQWYAPEKVASLAHVIADWNATHPQAAVSCKVLPGKRDALLQKILLAAQRGELADAVLVRNEWLGRLAAEGLIDPLPDALAATVRRSALPSLLLAIGDGQRIWATPFDADALVVWLRRDLADERDPKWTDQPWSLDRLASLAAKLTDRTNPAAVRYGFAFQGARSPNAANAFLPWYFGRGGRAVDEQGNLTLDAAPAAAALAWLMSLVKSGAAPSAAASLEQNDVFNGLAGGAFAMTLGGSWERGMLARQSHFGDRIKAMPAPTASERNTTTLLGGWSFVLLKKRHTDIAGFLALTLSGLVQREKLSHDSLLPVTVASLQQPWFLTSPDGPTLRQALLNGESLPFHKDLDFYLDTVATMIAEVSLGKQTPSEAAGLAAENIRQKK